MKRLIFEEDLETITAALTKDAQVLTGKTVLMTGAAGFLGNYIVGVLQRFNKTLPQPCKIIAIDNYLTGTKNQLVAINDPNIKTIEADVRFPLTISEPVDYIIHAAGLASPVYYKKYPLETLEVAVLGTKNMLELAKEKKAKSFLFFSSSEIYGDPDPNFIPTPETYRGNVSCLGPRACYDESKRLGETLCMIYHQLHNVPVKIVRPFNVYGPGMKVNDYRVVPMFLTSAIAGKNLPVHDKGNQTRAFCYITDATVGFLKVLLSSQNGEVYNVGSDAEEINMVSLANMVAELFDNKVKPELIKYPETYPADEPRRRSPDLTKIKTRLQYQPTIDLRNGLKRTLDWYREIIK